MPSQPHKPIIIIDDDREDLELAAELARVLHIPNQVVVFDNPIAALDYLVDHCQSVLFIICDINMPKLDGFQLRGELMDKVPGIENIPFFFLSTSKSPGEVKLSEEYKVTGYYQKANSFDDQKDIVKQIWEQVRDL